MNSNSPPDLDGFIHRMRSGEVTREEIDQLEAQLLKDPQLRKRYRERMRLESHLLSTCRSGLPDILPDTLLEPIPGRARRWPSLMAGAGIAAALMLSLVAIQDLSKPRPPAAVATLISESDAAWSSDSNLRLGAPLTAGAVELKNGLAELRFESGAIVALEAPARLELIDPMRCRLHQGTVLVEVPDAAKGFVVETTDGYAVDHGTRFSVNIDDQGGSADFEVLEGLISVHHLKTKTEFSLSNASAARMTAQGLQKLYALPSRQIASSSTPNHIRLRTEGREACIVRRSRKNDQESLLDPALLMVKRDITRSEADHEGHPSYARDRRSLIGFQLKGIEPDRVQQASLRLNLVPTGLGYASALPETSIFEVYGVRDVAQLERWGEGDLSWDKAPGSMTGQGPHDHAKYDGVVDSKEVRLLGRFEVPRGRTSGPVLFRSEALANFIREDQTGVVDFLLVRATPPTHGWSLVHAFASSSHPDAVGPALELEMQAAGDE